MASAWKYYKEIQGNKCPLCKSENINGHSFNADGLNAWRDVECHDCGEIWRELFIMTNIDIL